MIEGDGEASVPKPLPPSLSPNQSVLLVVGGTGGGNRGLWVCGEVREFRLVGDGLVPQLQVHLAQALPSWACSWLGWAC